MSKSRFSKAAVPQASNFVKNRLQHRCFPVKFVKFLEKTYFEEYMRTAAFKFIIVMLSYIKCKIKIRSVFVRKVLP